MPYQQLYKVKNFQNYYTLDMGGGTGTGTGTWIVNESLSSFPTEFPVILEVWDTDPTFSSTVELVTCSAANVGSKQLTISARGVDGTSPYNHANGSKVAINIVGVVHNNIVDSLTQAIADIATKVSTTTFNTLIAEGNVAHTSVMTTGEAYSATTTANGITGPTVLYRASSDGRLYRLHAAVSPQQLMDNVFLAYEASTGAGESRRVYHAGSIVGGWTGLNMNVIAYYPDTAVPGGLNTSVGSGWKQIIEPISTTSARLKDSGRNSQNHTTAGTSGTNAFNNGTATTLARSDHEHKVFYHFTPVVQSPTSGSTSVLFANKTSLTFDVVSFYAMTTGSVGGTTTTISLEKMAQSTVDGAFTPWTTITSPNLTIDASERSSNTAATPVGFSDPTLAPGEHLRMNIITAGSSIGDIQGFVVLKLKNTN